MVSDGQAYVWMCGEAGVALRPTQKIFWGSSDFHSANHTQHLCPEDIQKLTRESPETETDGCKGNLFLCLGKVNHKCIGLSLPWVYSHITIYVPGWGLDEETSAVLDSISLASGQEIDPMPVTVPSRAFPFLPSRRPYGLSDSAHP